MEILIIEDEMLVSHSLVDLLDVHGHRARVADDGLEALTMLRAGYRPDVIVLDLILPRMTGSQFLEMKRTIPELAPIPVVVLTGASVRDLPTGATSLLKKPTTDDALLEALRAAVGVSAPTGKDASARS